VKLGTKATIVGPSGPNVWWKTNPIDRCDYNF